MAGPEPGAVALDDLPDGVLVADATGSVVALNAAGGRLTGCDPAVATGLPLAQVLRLEEPDGTDWWRCTRPFDGLATRTVQTERRLLLAPPGTAPGAGRPLLVTARYVRERPAGPLLRLVVSFRDAGPRDRTDRLGSDLLATVAHELRSPLTSVKGFTATLLAKWERFTDEQRRLMLQTVHTDADRVTRLLGELLDVSRIDTRRLELRRQVVDLAAVAERVVRGRVVAGDPPERLAVRRDGSPPEMWLDPDKVIQILTNLVENGLRHGAGLVEVTVGPADVGGAPGAQVTVDDAGSGVPVEQRGRVFGKFWRGSRDGGSGLGLYVVRGLVEAHGGTIAVQDAPAGGARMVVRLPAGTPDFL